MRYKCFDLESSLNTISRNRYHKKVFKAERRIFRGKHRWFAWRPIRTEDNICVWFEFVYREYLQYGYSTTTTEYTLIEDLT